MTIGYALPARFYTDPEILAHERQRVFARHWQLLAHAEQLARPGDHLETELGEVPLILLQDEHGQRRALHAVCRHRAGPVRWCPGGAAGLLRCGYHGWRYGLDGRLYHAPDTPEGFPPEPLHLQEAHLSDWQGLLFGALAPETDLGSRTAALDRRLSEIDLSGYRFHQQVCYDIACNWKVYLDNYLEGYHVPHIHPTLNRMLDYRSYQVEVGDCYSLQWSPIDRSQGPYGEGIALYVFIYPNSLLNILPGRLQTNRVLPLAADRCRVVFDYYYRPGGESEAEADARFSDVVQQEDVGICEAVQRGLGSGSYLSGPLNPRREQALAHFRDLLLSDLK